MDEDRMSASAVIDDYRRHMERKGLRPRSIKKMLDVVSLFRRHIAPRAVPPGTSSFLPRTPTSPSLGSDSDVRSERT